MKLFDSHCHLDDRIFNKDRDDVIRRFKEAGISGAMIVGVNLNRSRKAVRLAESYDGYYASELPVS